MENQKALYACETKGCRFLFESESLPKCCPDCGKKNIRLANSREISEYEQRKMEFLLTKKHFSKGVN